MSDATLNATFFEYLVLHTRSRVIAYPEPLIEGLLCGFQGLASRLRHSAPLVFSGAERAQNLFDDVLQSVPPDHTLMSVRVLGSSLGACARGPLAPVGEWPWPSEDRLLLIYGGIEASGVFFSRKDKESGTVLAYWSFDPAHVKGAGLWIGKHLQQHSQKTAMRWASGFRDIDAQAG